MDQIEAFEQIYQDYLDQIRALDLGWIGPRLGVALEGEGVVIPLFGIPHRVSGAGIWDPGGKRPVHSVCVILSKYLILSPQWEPAGSEWVTYREFKDAAPFVGGFATHAERPISQAFAGRLYELEEAASRLGGQVVRTEVRADLAIRFQALPKVPMLMLFNDEDEDFPAQCSILFERRASRYLDMECLAILGWVLGWWLSGSYR